MTNIKRCIFNDIYIQTENPSDFYVINSIFDAHADTLPYFILFNGESKGIFACNNDFYNLPTVAAIKVVGTVRTARILNNNFELVGFAVDANEVTT
jgi:hypothetical protein